MHALALRAALPATDSSWWWLDIQGNAPGAIEDRCLVADVVTERLRELEQRYGEVKDVVCFWCDEPHTAVLFERWLLVLDDRGVVWSAGPLPVRYIGTRLNVLDRSSALCIFVANQRASTWDIIRFPIV